MTQDETITEKANSGAFICWGLWIALVHNTNYPIYRAMFSLIDSSRFWEFAFLVTGGIGYYGILRNSVKARATGIIACLFLWLFLWLSSFRIDWQSPAVAINIFWVYANAKQYRNVTRLATEGT